MPDESEGGQQPDEEGNDTSGQEEDEGKDPSLKEAGKFASILSKNFKILWKDYMEKGYSLEYTFEHYLRDTIEAIAHKVVKELQKEAYLDPDSPYHDILSRWGTPFFDAAAHDVRDQLFQRNKTPLAQVIDMDLAGMDALELAQRFLMSDDDDEDDDDKSGVRLKAGFPKPKVKLKVKPFELVQHGFHPEALEEIHLYERLKLSYRSEFIDFKAKLKFQGELGMEGISRWNEVTLPVLEKQAGGSAELQVQLTVHPPNQPFRVSINGSAEYSNMPDATRESRREEKIEASFTMQVEIWFEDRKKRDHWNELLDRERASSGRTTTWQRTTGQGR